MVNFSSVPSDTLVPFVAIEFNSDRATRGIEIQPYKALLVGQRLTAGTIPLIATKTCTEPKLVTSANQAATYFGTGSIAHRQAMAWFAQSPTTELWMVGVSDNGTTKQVNTLTVTGTATASGTLSIYVGGVLVEVAVNSGDLQDDVAAAIEDAVNAAFACTMVATSATNVATLTARNAGTAGKVDIRLNYRADQATPGGLAVAIAQSTAGATDPAITDVFEAIGDEWFNTIAIGWLNDTLFSAVDTELASRFGPMRPIDGRAFFCKDDTVGNLTSYGAGKNSKHCSVLGRSSALSPHYEYGACVAAIVAKEASRDPGRPYTGIPMYGILGPSRTNQHTHTERDVLLRNGISTAKSVGGVETLERLVTTYQTNTIGADDTAYRDVPTLDVLSLLRYSLRTRIAVRFDGCKLADDGTPVRPGTKVVTPATMRAEIIAWYQEMLAAGYVENLEAFKAALVVERNASDRNRLDIYLPPDLVNMLIVTAVNTSFLN